MNRVGRADLLTLLRCLGKEGLDQAAPCMGFYRRPKEPLAVTPKKEDYTGVLPTPAGEVKVEYRFDEAEPVVHFWRVVEYREKRETETQTDEPLWLKEAIAFSNDEVRADYSQPVPSKLPLLPWSRMWPFLFGILGYYCDTRSIDMEQAVEVAARAEPMIRLPLRQRLTWAGTCQLILDLDERLLPFWDDETDLLQRIEKLRGSSGLEVLVFEYGPEGPCRRWGKQLGEPGPYRLPMPGSPILIISDLGCLDTAENQEKIKKKLFREVQGAPRRREPIRGGIVSEDVFHPTTSTWNLHMPPLAEKSPPWSPKAKGLAAFWQASQKSRFFTHGPDSVPSPVLDHGNDPVLAISLLGQRRATAPPGWQVLVRWQTASWFDK